MIRQCTHCDQYPKLATQVPQRITWCTGYVRFTYRARRECKKHSGKVLVSGGFCEDSVLYIVDIQGSMFEKVTFQSHSQFILEA